MPRISTLSLVAALALSGCVVGPDYRRAQIVTPEGWLAPVPHHGDGSALIGWWSRFDDPILPKLQSAAEADSPTLDQAIARIKQARASLAASRAASFPSANAGASYSEVGQETDAGAGTAIATGGGEQATLDASWDIDLFGKVRRSNEAARARLEARVDDWHDARVSLAAEVADTYAQFRGCERLTDVLEGQVKSQAETARLTRINANAGFTAPSDAALAEASAASGRSTLTDQISQCEQLIKSLTALTAIDEPILREMLTPRRAMIPSAPSLAVASVPADTLRQRPDIASSERELAATSAEIGVAVADLYPSLTLAGSISVSSDIRQWSFGPSLSLPLFDGGRRRANVDQARAAYEAQLAAYRQAVRLAVRDIEQVLVRLDAARAREDDARQATEGYRANFEAMGQMHRAGLANLLDAEIARRNALDAERTEINLEVTQLREWIALYKALGGGWQSEDVPSKRLHSAEGSEQ